MPDSTELLKQEIADLEAALTRKKQALAILEPRMMPIVELKHRPLKAATLKQEPDTVSAMAQKALKKKGSPMTPKQIAVTINEMFRGEEVNEGTLASVLWTGANNSKVFVKGDNRGEYGLLEWGANGSATVANAE